MTRYHPLLVALHWLMGICILMSLIAGKAVLEHMPNSNPDKVYALGPHLVLGIVIGVLLVVRLTIRLTTEKPPRAETGNSLLDRIGAATHWFFYILVAVMVLSGLGTAFSNGLFGIVFGEAGGPIPEGISSGVPRTVHGIASTLLAALLLLHVAAALWHQFWLKDGLFRRMWFGKRAKG